MKVCTDKKILNEIRICLEANRDSGEEAIFYTGIVVGVKNNELRATFTTIADPEEKYKNKEIDYSRLDKAKIEYANAVKEIINILNKERDNERKEN